MKDAHRIRAGVFKDTRRSPKTPTSTYTPMVENDNTHPPIFQGTYVRTKKVVHHISFIRNTVNRCLQLVLKLAALHT